MQQQHVEPISQSAPWSRHDIFLSHSGAQKGFAKDLYKMLKDHGFSTFFDLEPHSLPLAERFPDLIFKAAGTCKLAMVVLSDEYLSTKWPMLELSAFVHARVRILPLFFGLSPSDLNDVAKVQEWNQAWSDHAASDARIHVHEWRKAFEHLISPQCAGLVHEENGFEGELSYIERIIDFMCKQTDLITRRNKYDTHYVQGEDRLVKVILDKFEKMEASHSWTKKSACLLGLYGCPSSGKSTLCRSLDNYFFAQYGSRSLYIQLPIDPTPQKLLEKMKVLLKLTKSHSGHDEITHIDKLNIDMKERLLVEALIPCLIRALPWKEEGTCIDWPKSFEYGGLVHGLWTDLDKAQAVILKHCKAGLWGKPKEVLLQHADMLMPSLRRVLDDLRNETRIVGPK